MSNHGKRAIAALPSGQEVIRDFPAGMEPCGFGWRMTWTGPATTDTGHTKAWARDTGSLTRTTNELVRRLIGDGCYALNLELAPMVDTGQPAGDLAAFLRQKA